MRLRDDAVRRLFDQGASSIEIAAHFGCTGQAVRLRAKKLGLSFETKRGHTAPLLYGCSAAEFLSVVSEEPAASQAYTAQRLGAANRNIEWLFTLPAWWEVWERSGKWPLRGAGLKQYCMARNFDRGPYAPDNVRIVTGKENQAERVACAPRRGRGWTLEKRAVSRPYFVRLNGRLIGYYATAEEASSAYETARAAALNKRLEHYLLVR